MNKYLKAKIIESFGSQWKFAQAINVHESDVSRVIRGRKMLKKADQKKWTVILNCKANDLGIGE